VLNAGIASLPVDAIQGNVVQDPEAVARIIQTLTEKHRVKAHEVIASVPGPAVIIKRATFPDQKAKELEETILIEAGNFIPESLENVNLDYQVLSHDRNADTVDVLLVAIRKDVIDSYVDVISGAGLTPVVVDVDYFALENMFAINYAPTSDAVVALVNIGARYSSINIMKGTQSVFTGDVPVGGRQFTEALAQELGLSYDQAEAVKVTGEGGRGDHKKVESVLAATTEHLIDEVHRALSFFWTSAAEEQIHTVYASGGAAQLPGLVSAMNERLQIPVEISNPFRHVALGRNVDERFIRQHASALAVSVGLATRKPGDK
jgi:type IV pilus assembly protein PilM